jgi:hypothetical protein
LEKVERSLWETCCSPAVAIASAKESPLFAVDGGVPMSPCITRVGVTPTRLLGEGVNALRSGALGVGFSADFFGVP